MIDADRAKVRMLLDSCSQSERERIVRFFLGLGHSEEVQKNVAAALAIEQNVSVKMNIGEKWRERNNKRAQKRPH